MAGLKFEFTEMTTGKREILSLTALRIEQTKAKIEEVAKLNADSEDAVFMTRCFGYRGGKIWHEFNDDDTYVIIQNAHGSNNLNKADFERLIQTIRSE